MNFLKEVASFPYEVARPMDKKKLSLNFFCFLLIFCWLQDALFAKNQIDMRLEPYVQTLREKGEEPVKFVLKKLGEHDLLLFDDAIHPAVEPFEFYQTLVKNRKFQEKVKYIFVEAFVLNRQSAVDAYLGAPKEDKKLLFSLFQDDYTGFGWTLKTYFDLMETIYRVNRSLPDKEKLKVIAVSNPVYWEGIKTREDIKLMRKSFLDRDYFMYKIILGEMDNFKSGRKGILLTNTRHAYKGIKNRNYELIWDNCGTFFHQWHPGKSYSIRFHNVLLIIDKKKENLDSGKIYSTGGLEQFDSRDVRVAEGLWDSAFKALGDRPLAVSMENTPFGRETYYGNLTHRSAPGQTMLDAYDALIFLAPLEKLRFPASVDRI